jgi:hypothetical protein
MKEFIERLIEKINDPSVSEETKELMRELLRQQAEHEKDLLDKITDVLRK